jgi:thiol-disulfide isomerase/thioredoxin/outer membrane lipoprotein-sorting protein
MKMRFWLFALVPLTLLTPSCKPQQGPKDFLAWSMDQHQALKSYSAKCEWEVDGGVMGGDASSRKIEYLAPNFFKINSARKGGLTATTVSDGHKLVDFTDDKLRTGMSYAAPANFHDAKSMQMMLPMSCGSLLYEFFGGSKGIDDLVDESRGKIADAGEEDLPGGGKGKLVKFYAKGAYGNATVLINEKTGMVYRISYDSAALLEKVKESGLSPEFIKPYESTETYSDIQINPTLVASNFKADTPEGMRVTDAAAIGDSPSDPIPVGKPAPDFTVVDMNGKEVKLSSLRGKPIFLDFWATWCGPCRQSLPHTQRIATEHGNEIKVLAISNESVDIISDFQKENHYTYPSYRDPDGLAGERYKVASIPTFVVIDAKGIVVDYQIGFRGEKSIDRALAKVGIKM